MPASGVIAEPASAIERTAVAAIVTARIERTTTQAPVTRAANSARRERPVAARSRNTPDSMSWVPAVPPTITPITMAIIVSTKAVSSYPITPPAGR